MDRNDVPEPYKSRIKCIKKQIAGPCIGIIRRSIRSSPNWETAQQEIVECLEVLHKNAYACKRLME